MKIRGFAIGIASTAIIIVSLALVRRDDVLPPIIDVHQHALPASFWGTPDPAWFPPYVASPRSDSAVMHQTLAAMEEFNIVRAMTSGTPEWVDRWHAAAPQRIVRATSIFGPCTPDLVDQLRELHTSEGYRVMGEISWQFGGIAFNDPRVEPCFALAAELDIPMGIHVGLGPRGARIGRYSASGGRPLDLEKMLIRYPDVRVYLMHAGWPLLHETIALMHAHSQVYADISLINWYIPREAFHSYLEALIDAGLGDRLMYGSDSGVWPGVIGRSIETVRSAPFLSDAQKRDIFYNNAVRFFQLDQAAIGSSPN